MKAKERRPARIDQHLAGVRLQVLANLIRVGKPPAMNCSADGRALLLAIVRDIADALGVDMSARLDPMATERAMGPHVRAWQPSAQG